MMTTITIQIGNSDDKLTQLEWSRYVTNTRVIIERYAHEIHFFGGSKFDAPWQNVAWCITFHPRASMADFTDALTRCRDSYDQDSIAFTVGETEFI